MLEPTHGRLFIAQFQTWSGYVLCRNEPERSEALDRFKEIKQGQCGSLKWSDSAVCVPLQNQTNNVRPMKELMMNATSIEIEGYAKTS